MLKLRQAIIVEGRYDKAKLSGLVDATILTTDGFGIFHNREKLQLIRRLAAKNGIILLTDSDAAGFKIRHFLAGAIPKEQIIHVYIPDLFGKERRKTQPSAEGKLGVEGIPAQLLLEAFQKAGVSTEVVSRPEPRKPVTMADLMEWGICGGPDSAQKRRLLLHRLGLPQRLNVKGMLQVINTLYSREQVSVEIQSLFQTDSNTTSD